jgi:hypothetical protein
MFVASWGDKRKQFVGILFKNEKKEKTIVSALLFKGLHLQHFIFFIAYEWTQ